MIARALVVVDPRDGLVPSGQLGVLAQACDVATVVEAVLFGPADPDLVALLGRHGAQVVHTATIVTTPVAGSRTDVVQHLVAARAIDAVLLENSSLSADVSAALAVRLEAGVNWDLVALDVRDEGLVGTRLALQDTLLVSVGWTTTPCIGVFRAGVLEPGPAGFRDSPRVREVDVALRAEAVRLVRRIDGDGVLSGLDTAQVVVAGGRGLGSADNIALLEGLAAALGGVVGVSMPVVDKGWYPYSHQIGQTGCTVRPKLYVACGISGAIQHRVGMSRSGTIVAINTDRQAPVFAICDFGVVGDLTDVVPRLTALLREHDPGS